MTDTQLIYYEPCEKITRFDIYTASPYSDIDFIIECTALTLPEVWEFLCTCRDRKFRVTAANRPSKCFMSGCTYFDYVFTEANRGEAAIHLCYATKEEMAEIQVKARAREKREEAEARIRHKAKEMTDGSAEKD